MTYLQLDKIPATLINAALTHSGALSFDNEIFNLIHLNQTITDFLLN